MNIMKKTNPARPSGRLFGHPANRTPYIGRPEKCIIYVKLLRLDHGGLDLLWKTVLYLSVIIGFKYYFPLHHVVLTQMLSELFIRKYKLK